MAAVEVLVVATAGLSVQATAVDLAEGDYRSLCSPCPLGSWYTLNPAAHTGTDSHRRSEGSRSMSKQARGRRQHTFDPFALVYPSIIADIIQSKERARIVTDRWIWRRWR